MFMFVSLIAGSLLFVVASYLLFITITRTIFVHRSEDVIFSARIKKCCICIFLSTYISINLCINSYQSMYQYLSICISISYKFYELIFRYALWVPCMPSQQIATTPSPWPPCPTYIHLYIHLCTYLYLSFFVIHLQLFSEKCTGRYF